MTLNLTKNIHRETGAKIRMPKRRTERIFVTVVITFIFSLSLVVLTIGTFIAALTNIIFSKQCTVSLSNAVLIISSADNLPTLQRQFINSWPSVGKLSAVCWPTVGWLFTYCGLPVGPQAVDIRPTVRGRELFFTITHIGITTQENNIFRS